MRHSIQSIIDLTQTSDQDRVVLKDAAHQTEQWADEFVKMFYDILFDYPHTKELFRAGERPEREKTLRDWYLQVVRGEFDEEFWLVQWQVGQRHVGREILNSYVFGMMNRTQQFFLDKCLATFEKEEGLKIFSAFKRVTDVAAGIIANGYLMSWRIGPPTRRPE